MTDKPKWALSQAEALKAATEAASGPRTHDPVGVKA